MSDFNQKMKIYVAKDKGRFGFAIVSLCKTKVAGIVVRTMITGNVPKQFFIKKYARPAYVLSGVDVIHDNRFYFGIYPELRIQISKQKNHVKKG
jgi:hypothetical protein